MDTCNGYTSVEGWEYADSDDLVFPIVGGNCIMHTVNAYREYVFFNESIPYQADERVKHVIAQSDAEAIFDVKPFEWTAYAVVTAAPVEF